MLSFLKKFGYTSKIKEEKIYKLKDNVRDLSLYGRTYVSKYF